MKIKLIFDSQFVGRLGKTVEIQSNISEEDIKSLFLIYLEVPYDENCTYEIIE